MIAGNNSYFGLGVNGWDPAILGGLGVFSGNLSYGPYYPDSAQIGKTNPIYLNSYNNSVPPLNIDTPFSWSIVAGSYSASGSESGDFSGGGFFQLGSIYLDGSPITISISLLPPKVKVFTTFLSGNLELSKWLKFSSPENGTEFDKNTQVQILAETVLPVKFQSVKDNGSEILQSSQFSISHVISNIQEDHTIEFELAYRIKYSQELVVVGLDTEYLGYQTGSLSPGGGTSSMSSEEDVTLSRIGIRSKDNLPMTPGSYLVTIGEGLIAFEIPDDGNLHYSTGFKTAVGVGLYGGEINTVILRTSDLKNESEEDYDPEMAEIFGENYPSNPTNKPPASDGNPPPSGGTPLPPSDPGTSSIVDPDFKQLNENLLAIGASITTALALQNNSLQNVSQQIYETGVMISKKMNIDGKLISDSVSKLEAATAGLQGALDLILTQVRNAINTQGSRIGKGVEDSVEAQKKIVSAVATLELDPVFWAQIEGADLRITGTGAGGGVE